MNGRLLSLEEDVYNKETKNDRVTRLESKINNVDLQLKLDLSEKEAKLT